jgi:hypothetical protein
MQFMPEHGVTATNIAVVAASSIVAAVVGLVPAASEAAWTNAPLIITSITALIAGVGVFYGKRSEAVSKRNAENIEMLKAAASIRIDERAIEVELANARAAESAAKIAELHALAESMARKVEEVRAVSVDNATNILKVEKATNSMHLALVQKTEDEALARGNLQGVAEEVARQQKKEG